MPAEGRPTFYKLTLFHLSSGMTLSPEGGGRFDPLEFEPYNLVKSHTNTQNLVLDDFFDIQAYFDRTISTVKEV